jgi:hypothetical protein
MDEFNLRFDKIIQDIPQTHQPTLATIMFYYLNSFHGKFSFFLIEAKPTDLTYDKRKAKNVDDNWVLLGKPYLLAPLRARVDPNPRNIHTIKQSPDPFITILEGMKRLEMNFSQTICALQNRIVQVEINQQQNMFPLGNGYQGPP